MFERPSFPSRSFRRASAAAVGLALAVVSGVAVAQQKQDKYALQVPNGLAFSEFSGYEGWQVVSTSHDGPLLAVILGNPLMIAAYQSGVPGNGQPFPDGAKMAKVHWNPKTMETFPSLDFHGKESP